MKKQFERARPDRTQPIRQGIQVAFLLLNVWIAVQFYQWVRYFENQGAGGAPARPAGVEGWLPIASLMNLKVLLLTGELPQIHPAGVFLLIAFVAISWLLRRSFCSWLCPVGTFSEYLWMLGKKLFRRNWTLPKWADYPLRSLKFILLALFGFVIASMPVEGIRAFLDGPYGIVADVKMLNFFREMSLIGVSVMGALVLLSILVKNFWCRYLCPYGAFLGFFSLLSPLRIRREAELCIDCGKCQKACPSNLPVDQLVTIKTMECTGCMTCVASCPVQGALFLSHPKQRRVPGWAVAASIAMLFFGLYGYARVTAHWDTSLPDSLYRQLVPRASEFSHPR